MSADAYVQVAVCWFFCLLLCGGALLSWADSGQRSHLAFAARQIILTVAVTVGLVIDHLPSLAIVFACMALNVLSYNPIIARSRKG